MPPFKQKPLLFEKGLPDAARFASKLRERLEVALEMSPTQLSPFQGPSQVWGKLTPSLLPAARGLIFLKILIARIALRKSQREHRRYE
jgi:hypothetical protein